MGDECGWVLERGSSPVSEPAYWAAGQIDPTRSSAWTGNYMAAIRFARKADAQAVADRLMKKAGVNVRVCEHIWTENEPCLSPAEQKAQGLRCGCMGADDYCVCQNVPDATTRAERKAAGLP